jgi:hypothetical protein
MRAAILASGIMLGLVSASDDVLDATATFVRDIRSDDEPEGRMLRRTAEQFLEEPSAANFARLIDAAKSLIGKC